MTRLASKMGLFSALLLVSLAIALASGRMSNARESAGSTATALASKNYYVEFVKSHEGAVPEGFVAASNVDASRPAYAIENRDGDAVLSERPANPGDVLYYKQAGSYDSLSESYSFVYYGQKSVVEPYLVKSAATEPVSGYTVNLEEANDHNAADQGRVYVDMGSGGSSNDKLIGTLRTAPYHYVVGHTYRVDLVANPSTDMISCRVYDTSYGPQAFDKSILNLSAAGRFSVYPGIVNRFGGTIVVRDLNFGPADHLSAAPHVARRANDYLDSIGFVYQSFTEHPETDVGVKTTLKLLLQLLVVHIRTDLSFPNVLHTESEFSTHGIKTDCLTNYRTSVDDLKAVQASLVGGCDSIELANEPNAYLKDPFPKYRYDLPQQAAMFRMAFPSATIWGPSILPNLKFEPRDQMAMARLQPAGVPVIAESLSAVVDHPYIKAEPETVGVGPHVVLCGRSFTEGCGFAGSLNYFDREASTLAPDLPIVSTEGVASYGSYPAICGRSNVDLSTQQAYVERGFMFAFKAGHVRDYGYKLVDDGGGCSDGFGTYGIINKLKDPSGKVLSENPKPAFTALANMNHLLYDQGESAGHFKPATLRYSLTGATPDVEEMLLAESDGSYRLVLWSDRPLWDFAGGHAVDVPGTDVTLRLRNTCSLTTFSQAKGTGVWSVGEHVSDSALHFAVTAFPTIVDIIPPQSMAGAASLPSSIATPGPMETPTSTVPGLGK